MGSVKRRHDYTDEDGELLYQVERLDPKGFRQRRPDPDRAGAWIWNLTGIRRVLYRLPEIKQLIAAQDNRPVYLCEGEKDAEALTAWGLCATTCAMGANAPWLGDYTDQLAGVLQVVVLPDNDEPGRAHAQKVAAALDGAGIEVRIVALPGLKAKGDVFDWIESGGTQAGLQELVGGAPVWLPPVREGAPSAESASGRRRGGFAIKLVELGRELFEFVVSETGEPFAIPRGADGIVVPFRRPNGPRQILAHAYAERYGKVPPASSMTDALQVLEGDAARAERVSVHVRFGIEDDVIWVDLGDPIGSAVRVDKNGWQVVRRPGILFRRSDFTAELPWPSDTGDFDEIFDYIHAEGEMRALIRGWMVGAMIPGTQTPILCLTGEQGTGKTTAAKAIVSVTDPCTAPLQGAPKDQATWGMIADSCAIVSLDNLSVVANWLADSMCRAVTGDAVVARRLYTDGEPVVRRFKRPIIVTGIALGTLPADLVDRMLFVELERITSAQTRLDCEMERRLEESRSRIFGGLLDLVSKVLKHRATTPVPPDAPRPADHAHILAALDAAIGGGHLDAYRRAKADAMIDASRGSALVEAVVEHMCFAPDWIGTPSQLMEELRRPDPPPGWPCNEQRISQELTRSAHMLLVRGVHYENRKSNGRRLITLRWAGTAEQSWSEEGTPGTQGTPRTLLPQDLEDEK